jgi:hypothetical protein
MAYPLGPIMLGAEAEGDLRVDYHRLIPVLFNNVIDNYDTRYDDEEFYGSPRNFAQENLEYLIKYTIADNHVTQLAGSDEDLISFFQPNMLPVAMQYFLEANEYLRERLSTVKCTLSVASLPFLAHLLYSDEDWHHYHACSALRHYARA